MRLDLCQGKQIYYSLISGIIQESGFGRKDSTEFPVPSQPTEICGNWEGPGTSSSC